MGKINVIIAHEYITRVKSRWFIISTLLGPLGMALMVVLPILATVLTGDGTEGKIAVLDRSGSIGHLVMLADTSKYEDAGNRSEQQLAEDVRQRRLQAYVVVPADVLDQGALTLYSRGGSGFSFESGVESDFEPFIVKARLTRAGTDTSVIELVEQGVDLSSLKITEKGVEEDSSTASAAIGYFAGFVIYFLIFLYGTMVMRGVVEEKANRIVEVLASSVRPYEIMMGKVVGIGLVGLTQVLAWIVLGAGVMFILAAVFGGSMSQEDLAQITAQPNVGLAQPQAGFKIGSVAIPGLNVLSLVLFAFYFLAGYFIYATLFAAVGSAVDQEADAQSLTLPISLPIIFTIMFIGSVVSAPNSTMSVVLSLFPLFTPILMTVRVAATDVAWWQIAASIVLTISAFLGAVWMASRIYRIGILSYGKKPTFKDILRWVR
jgi:ABC-2 type transport system permease protein